ncbi:MAG: type II toxin-antitoxin system RelE/ParE family toxin [Phycisphaeraceae bacterium]
MIDPIISPEAFADLDDIWEHIAKHNPQAADRWIEELLAKCNSLVEWPRSGRARPELTKGLRSYPHGDYLIFYKPQKDTVFIARIVHGARNLDGLFA